MNKIDGGALFVRTIQRHGVTDMFTLHGGHLDSIYQACLDHGIRLVDVRHEAAAGHAADAFSRLGNSIGICLVTAGPGFTNAITAMATAHLDCIPTLFIAGAPPLRDAEINPLQGGFNQVAMAAPVTKWAHQVTHTHHIPRLVDHAIKIARTGRPGPVFLEIPIDVLFGQVNERAVTTTPVQAVGTARPNDGDVERALAILQAAERPVIMIGGGALLSGCADALLSFAERTGTPVFSNNKAHGLIDADHPLAGRSFNNLTLLEGSRPDTALVVGARFGLFMGGISDRIVPFDARLVHVDLDSREIGRLRETEVGIVADARETLQAFDAVAASMPWPARPAWQAQVRHCREGNRRAFADAPAADGKPIHPYRAAEAVAEVVTEDTILVTDGGEAKSWVEMAGVFPKGSRYLSLGYLGCLGVGMPYAIGAQIARPDARVICVAGDGAVGLNIQEFDTMVRHRLPIVTIIFNNHSWGLSAHAQDLIYGANRRVVSDLAPTDYSAVAAGFGCHAENVSSLSELKAALRRSLGQRLPACINVSIDYDVIAPYTKAMIGSWESDAEIVLPYYDNLTVS